MKKILIIEDDPAIRMGLEISLKEESFEVIASSDGEQGYEKAKKEQADLIILDLMLPKKNGMDICRELRSEGVNIPIIMLTSKSDELDKVLGLEIGANDYLTKPFSIRELIARIKVQFRQQNRPASQHEMYVFDSVQVDFRKHEVKKNGKALKLSVMEFNILKYFIEHESEVITRELFLDDVWGYDSFPTTRTVDNYILSLRKKIEDNPSSPKHILTIHTAGYKFVP